MLTVPIYLSSYSYTIFSTVRTFRGKNSREKEQLNDSELNVKQSVMAQRHICVKAFL